MLVCERQTVREGVYIGSRAGTVTTMLFDNDHNFLLDSQSSTHSDGGEVSVLYRYLFTLLLLCLTQRHTRVDPSEGKATAVQDHMSVNQDSKGGQVSPLIRQKRVDSRTVLEQGKKCSPDEVVGEEVEESTGSVPKPLPARYALVS